MIQPNTHGIKLCSIVVALFIVAGCARTTQKEQPESPVAETADTHTTELTAAPGENEATIEPVASQQAPEVPAIDPVIEQWSDSLRKHFNAAQFAQLNRAAQQFKAIASASDLAHFYQVILRDSIQPMVEQQFRTGCAHADYSGFADDDWDWLGEALPFIGTKVSCRHLDNGSVSCVHLAPISLLPLRDVASETPELEDDLFFDALIAIHTGTEPGQFVGFEVFDGQDNYHSRSTADCDPCTVGMLGDGHRAELIAKMSEAASARKLFNKAFTTDIAYVLGSLQQKNYRYSKAAVIRELDEIIATGATTKLLTKREITALQETHLWVQAKEGGFDCSGGNCDEAQASFE